MGNYTIRSGDTLSSIASRHGISLKALESANPQISNPNRIYAGQVIQVPDAYSAPRPAPVNLNGASASPGRYTVRSGDTLGSIGARFGVPYQAIASANGISNPNRIYPGQVLSIPGAGGTAGPPAPAHVPEPTTYTVRSGDSLSSIGARYGVSYQAIAQANGLANPNLIFPGQRLRIPGGAGGSGPVAAPPPAAPPPSAGATYTVRSGDTLSSIGARFGVPYTAIAAANGISNPNMIYPGQVLHIPGANGGGGAPPPSGPVGNPGSWNPGPGRLDGADTSNWQSEATFEQSIAGKQFTAIKASEGTGWTDPSFRARWDLLGQKIASGQMKLRIAYHFMQPGDGVGQAQHFLDTLGIHGPLQAGTRLALDWEASALNDPGALRDAANYIHNVTGVWPLIYTSGSQVGRARAAVPQAPMWEAIWGSNVPSDVPFVQYSDGPGFDHDVFNGDLAALERFAGWN